jgi:hypothetical protein
LIYKGLVAKEVTSMSIQHITSVSDFVS